MSEKKMETVHLSKHRVVMHLHAGGLHKWAHVPLDEKIPEAKVQEAINSDNPHVAAMGRLAHTFAGFHHGGK